MPSGTRNCLMASEPGPTATAGMRLKGRTEARVATVTELTCPSCARANPEDALFCAGCATPLACPGCRARLVPDSTYCLRCGRPIGGHGNLSGLEPMTSP